MYFNPQLEFTFHERQEQEYYVHGARCLGLAAAHPGISFQLTEAGCRVVLKTAYWILLYIIGAEQAQVVERVKFTASEAAIYQAATYGEIYGLPGLFQRPAFHKYKKISKRVTPVSKEEGPCFFYLESTSSIVELSL